LTPSDLTPSELLVTIGCLIYICNCATFDSSGDSDPNGSINVLDKNIVDFSRSKGIEEERIEEEGDCVLDVELEGHVSPEKIVKFQENLTTKRRKVKGLRRWTARKIDETTDESEKIKLKLCEENIVLQGQRLERAAKMRANAMIKHDLANIKRVTESADLIMEKSSLKIQQAANSAVQNADSLTNIEIGNNFSTTTEIVKSISSRVESYRKKQDLYVAELMGDAESIKSLIDKLQISMGMF